MGNLGFVLMSYKCIILKEKKLCHSFVCVKCEMLTTATDRCIVMTIAHMTLRSY